MRWCSAACALLVTAGCAAPADVKTASTAMTATIEELDDAVTAYGDRRDAQIEEIADDLRKAVVARVVANHVEAWSASNQNAGLIDVSRQIEGAQDGAREMVARVSEIQPRPGDTPEVAVAKFFEDLAAAHEKTSKIQALPASIRAKFAARAAAIRGGLREDGVTPYLVAIASLEQAKGKTKEALAPLHDFVAVMRDTHAILHAGVMTDVAPDGAALAKVVNEYLALHPEKKADGANAKGDAK